MEKSISLIERLNSDNEEKSTLEGKELHTLMALSVKTLQQMGLSGRGLYSLYTCALVAKVDLREKIIAVY